MRSWYGNKTPLGSWHTPQRGGPQPDRIAPTVAAVGTIVANATSAVIPIPAGYVTDDIGYLCVDTANEAVTTPAGWTALTPRGMGSAGAGGAVRISTFWKRLVAASDTDPTVATTVDHICGVILIIRGCPNNQNPVMQEIGGAENPGTAVAFGTLTTTQANSLIVHAVSRSQADAGPVYSGVANPDLLGIAELFDAGTTINLGGGMGIFAGVKVLSGLVSSTTVTATAASNIGRQTVEFRAGF